jgi:hypothetical protein
VVPEQSSARGVDTSGDEQGSSQGRPLHLEIS